MVTFWWKALVSVEYWRFQLDSVLVMPTIIIENEKFFELKSRGYRDGIKKRQDKDGV